MLEITPQLRKKLKRPLGKLCRGRVAFAAFPAPLMAVGDHSILKLLQAGFVPKVMVYDFKVKRRPIPLKQRRALEAVKAKKLRSSNPSGTITASLSEAVKKAVSFHRPAKVFVNGEDDLAVIPLMLYAVKGTIVYGQPGKGLVVIRAGKASQKRAKRLLGEFK